MILELQWMSGNITLSLRCPNKALQMATLPYRELIGSLLWVSNGTRSDVSYPVNTLTKFTSNPGLIHWRAALRVLGFINATRNYCIRYAQQIHLNNISSSGFMRGILPNHIDLNCYVDASHASDIDTRRSITGYIFFYLWRSSIMAKPHADICCPIQHGS